MFKRKSVRSIFKGTFLTMSVFIRLRRVERISFLLPDFFFLMVTFFHKYKDDMKNNCSSITSCFLSNILAVNVILSNQCSKIFYQTFHFMYTAKIVCKYMQVSADICILEIFLKILCSLT